jgi:colicin import membrane protein
MSLSPWILCFLSLGLPGWASTPACAGAPPILPAASQARSTQTARIRQYTLAIQQAVSQNWLRPDGFPEVACSVRIYQSVGGKVLDAKIESDCPYDEKMKTSVRNAALRTWVLPYKGFEDVFRPTMVITFNPVGS